MNTISKVLPYPSTGDLVKSLEQYIGRYTTRGLFASFWIKYINSVYYVIVTVSNMTYRVENVDLRTALLDIKHILPKPTFS